MKINEYSETIEHLQNNVAGGNFLPDLHRELSDLSRQLSDCLHQWISYFMVTQTRAYRLFRQCTYSNFQTTDIDLVRDQQYLISLHQTVLTLQVQHQQSLNRLLEHYLNRLVEGDTYSTFIPYLNNHKADSIFIAYYAMYYSTTRLAQAVLTLGETIHTIVELETTRFYRPF